MTKSTTGGIGNISNFIVGGTFVFVSSMIYHRKKSKKENIALGLISGTLIMSVIAIFSNKYLIFPYRATSRLGSFAHIYPTI